MIEYIKGQIAEITPASVTIETNGVGYELNISLNTYTALHGKDQGRLYVHESIREDAYQLFGFFDKHERELFRQLISVSGIGPSTGRMILSSMTPKELATTIASGDAKTLTTVKGIGSKTAQRVIVDLKDKIKLGDEVEISIPTVSSPAGDEAVAALVMLGFTQKPSEKAVEKILKESPDFSVEKIIKTALKML